jgi:RNA polymerase sigma-70 factor (ECF subfamily)
MCVSFVDIATVVSTPVMPHPRENALSASTAAAASALHRREAPHPLDAIMDRYARGDAAAFDELFRYGAPKVRGFLQRLSGDAALAEDLTQETFLRVHRARGSFAPGAAAVPWLLAIARNTFLDQTRRARARPRTVDEDGQTSQHEAPPSARGDEALAAREMADVVRRTLQALPVLQREAFVLVRFEGLSIGEAAEVLGASEGAVKVRAFRAYEALREALKAAEIPPGTPHGGGAR